MCLLAIMRHGITITFCLLFFSFTGKGQGVYEYYWGIPELNEIGISAQFTDDGGAIFMGNTTVAWPPTSDRALSLAKFDSTGTIEWERLEAVNGFSYGTALLVTPDGGYVFSGETAVQSGNPGFHAFVMKTNSMGIEEWRYVLSPEAGYDPKIAHDITPTVDGGFLVTGLGRSLNSLAYSMITLKINAAGQQDWIQYHSVLENAEGKRVIYSEEEGIFVLGHTWTGSIRNSFLMKMDENGNEIWRRILDLDGDGSETQAHAMVRDEKGNFYLSLEAVGGSGFALVKLAPEGDLLWTKEFGGRTVRDLIVSKANSLVLAGRIQGFAYILQTDLDGNENLNISFDHWSSSEAHHVEEGSEHGFLIAGQTSTSMGNDNFLIMKTNCEGEFTDDQTPDPPLFIVYPNPFIERFTLRIAEGGLCNLPESQMELTLYDATGKAVYPSYQTFPNYIEIERANLSSGLYYYSISLGGESVAFGKVIAADHN